jgi:surfeit locus 1 family protein
MNSRVVALAAISTIFAILCVLLGVWQLQRHGERQELIAKFGNRLRADPVSLRQVVAQGGDIINTPVRVRGSFDVSHEMVLVNRTRNGAPGVWVVTPMLLPGSDSAVLVNRGWVYSPDGGTVDLSRWREGIPMQGGSASRSEELELEALALVFVSAVENRSASRDSASGTLRLPYLGHELVSAELPYPVSRVFVQLLPQDTIIRQGVPVPVPAPSLGAGSHLSYAMQWFAFAIIAVVGGVAAGRGLAGRQGTHVPNRRR